MESLLKPFVDIGGYLDSDKSTTTARITAFDESIARLEARLAVREKKLVAQYSNLQGLLAQLSGQQNFLGMFMASSGSEY